MSIVASAIGIDAHQRQLHVSIGKSKAFQVPNQEGPVSEFVAALPAGSVAHVEASGGYERLVCRVLREAGLEARVHNPLKARRLFQAVGSSAKTDALDARGLSDRGPMLPVRPPKSAERQGLTDLSRAIDGIKSTASEFKKRCDMPEIDPHAREAYRRVVQALTEQLKGLRREFHELVTTSSSASLYELALTVPDIGAETARVCVSELPENWRTASLAQLSVYAGLAPIDDSSGKRVQPARLGRGNFRLKAIFYMPALLAVQRRQWAKDLYARLRAKGRAHQQAIIAVMRRLFLRVMAVLRRGSPWTEEAPDDLRNAVAAART
jgi:transposase